MDESGSAMTTEDRKNAEHRVWGEAIQLGEQLRQAEEGAVEAMAHLARVRRHYLVKLNEWRNLWGNDSKVVEEDPLVIAAAEEVGSGAERQAMGVEYLDTLKEGTNGGSPQR